MQDAIDAPYAFKDQSAEYQRLENACEKASKAFWDLNNREDQDAKAARLALQNAVLLEGPTDAIVARIKKFLGERK